MTEGQRSGRVTVTHPRTVAVTRGPRPGIRVEASAPISPRQLRLLMRAQLRLSLTYVSLVGALLVVVPILLAHVDWLSTKRIAGVPLAWLIVGGLFFPVFVIVGRFYVRSVERLERRFVELVTE